MLTWQEDLVAVVDDACSSTDIAFPKITKAANKLGFDHVSYGIRIPTPMAKPKVLILDNYPAGWMQRYVANDYVSKDPTVRHATTTQAPVLWSDLQAAAPEFWEDARGFGLAYGWAQSTLDGTGSAGLLTLSRGGEPISGSELTQQGQQLRWLASLSHLALFRRLRGEVAAKSGASELTKREIEVLKWSAAGKTNDEIGDILNLSCDTIKYHLKNIMRKMGCFNKTQAVAHAAMLGLLA